MTPYIDKETRKALDHERLPKTPGELCFILAREVGNYIEDNGENFQTMSEALGALEAAKHETYRRVIAKYEDRKLLQNGDVYFPLLEDDDGSG